jgi:hypothetical protein
MCVCYYPQDICSAFGDKLEQLRDAGRLKAPMTLREELQGKDDDWRQRVLSARGQADCSAKRSHDRCEAFFARHPLG